MKVVALVSGGKDSTFNMMLCTVYGHEVVAMANLFPPVLTEGADGAGEEMDSFMYQTVGASLIPALADCAGLPLFREPILGVATQQGLTYVHGSPDEPPATAPAAPGAADEVEDLYRLLQRVVTAMPEVAGVSVGAIASDYQRVRVESVCARLGLTPLCYLWRADQGALLRRIIRSGVEAVVCKVACMGLRPKSHVGQRLEAIEPHLRKLHAEFDCHICGEGGEYETFTLACPLFPKRLVLDDWSVDAAGPEDEIAVVGHLRVAASRTEPNPSFGAGDVEGVDPVPLARRRADAREPPSPAAHRQWRAADVDAPQGDQAPTRATTRAVGRWVAVCVSARRPLGAPAASGQASSVQATMAAMERLAEELAQLGASMGDILITRLHLADMSHYAAVNGVFGAHFKGTLPCARAAVALCLEGTSDQLRLDAVAWIAGPGAESGDTPEHKHTLHVQSVSEWAPRMIGPYAQAAWPAASQSAPDGPPTWGAVAGSIGLYPPTMSLAPGGTGTQAAQALANVDSVLDAIGRRPTEVVSAVTYVASTLVDEGDAGEEVAAWITASMADSARPSPLSLGIVVSGLPMASAVEVQVNTTGFDAGRVGGGERRAADMPLSTPWAMEEEAWNEPVGPETGGGRYALEARMIRPTGVVTPAPVLHALWAFLRWRRASQSEAAPAGLVTEELLSGSVAALRAMLDSVEDATPLMVTVFYARALGSLVEGTMSDLLSGLCGGPAVLCLPVEAVSEPRDCCLAMTIALAPLPVSPARPPAQAGAPVSGR